MTSIEEKIGRVSEARRMVMSHCMTYKYEETKNYAIVIYPDGYFPNGARVSLQGGKERALQRLLDICERHWQESMWWR